MALSSEEIKSNKRKKNLQVIGTIAFISLIPFFYTLSTRYLNTSHWILFTSNSGRFKIEIPNTPNETIKKVKVSYGELIPHLFIYDASNTHDDNISYSISYVDYPDSLINPTDSEWNSKFYDGINEKEINTLHGTIDHVYIDSFNTYPGQEIKISFKIKNMLMVCREEDFFVRNRLYSISVITHSVNDFNNSIDRFFNSFKLL
jgi:hypothetical protein